MKLLSVSSERKAYEKLQTSGFPGLSCKLFIIEADVIQLVITMGSERITGKLPTAGAFTRTLSLSLSLLRKAQRL